MLASRCASSYHFNSRAGSRLVACAALGGSLLAVAASASTSATRGVRRVAMAGAAKKDGGPLSRKGGRALTKSELPTKNCAACGLPMNYRAKWAKVWDEVKFCSDRCRNASKRGGGGTGGAEGAPTGEA